MTNIFISYNRKTEAITKALAEDFEALGHTVWRDQELSGGQSWWEQILAMVRRCELFVFVLDPASLDSTACKREYGYAEELGKPILPVLVSEGVNVNLLPPALSRIQFVDYTKQDRSAVLRLAKALSSVPPPKPLPDPLPPPPEIPLSYLGSLSAQVDDVSTLSYEQQSALLFDLTRSLRDPEVADDVRGLLAKLRKRRDLFATIAEEIDELTGSMRKAALPVSAAVEPAPPPHEPLQKKEPPRVPFEKELLKEQASLSSSLLTDQTKHETTPADRMLGAGLLAVIGAGPWLFVDVARTGFDFLPGGFLPAIPFAVGGAIAGAISGNKPPQIIVGVMGIVVAILFQFVFGFTSLSTLLALLLPPLSVLASMYFLKRKA